MEPKKRILGVRRRRARNDSALTLCEGTKSEGWRDEDEETRNDKQYRVEKLWAEKKASWKNATDKKDQ